MEDTSDVNPPLNSSGLVDHALEMANQLDQYAIMLRTLCKSLTTLESCFPAVAVKLTRPIASLGVSVRTINALEGERINTVAEVMMRTEDQLRQVRNVGDSSFREIVSGLERLGLKLPSV